MRLSQLDGAGFYTEWTLMVLVLVSGLEEEARGCAKTGE